MYIDSHERDDVVKHRKEYLKVMEELRKTPQPQVGVEEDDKKKLTVLYHEESIYNTDEGQTWKWAEEHHPTLLLQKLKEAE